MMLSLEGGAVTDLEGVAPAFAVSLGHLPKVLAPERVSFGIQVGWREETVPLLAGVRYGLPYRDWLEAYMGGYLGGVHIFEEWGWTWRLHGGAP